MVTPIPIVLVSGLYVIIFLGAFVAGVIGLITGPRHWSQRLCKWNLWVTGAFLTLLAGTLLCFALLGALHGEIAIGSILLFIFLLCAPLLLVFLALLIVWMCRVSPSGG